MELKLDKVDKIILSRIKLTEKQDQELKRLYRERGLKARDILLQKNPNNEYASFWLKII